MVLAEIGAEAVVRNASVRPDADSDCRLRALSLLVRGGALRCALSWLILFGLGLLRLLRLACGGLRRRLRRSGLLLLWRWLGLFLRFRRTGLLLLWRWLGLLLPGRRGLLLRRGLRFRLAVGGLGLLLRGRLGLLRLFRWLGLLMVGWRGILMWSSGLSCAAKAGAAMPRSRNSAVVPINLTGFIDAASNDSYCYSTRGPLVAAGAFHACVTQIPGAKLLRLNVDSGESVQESENVQEPEHDDDNDDRVQNGFDGALHRDEAIDEPEQDADRDEDHQNLK